LTQDNKSIILSLVPLHQKRGRGEIKMNEKGLSVRESFSLALDIICKKFSATEVVLIETPKAVIASDVDCYKVNHGYSAYGRVMILTINDKEYIVALGTTCGDYPADPYNCDIAIIPVVLGKLSELKETIFTKLSNNYYFENSIVVARDDGRTVFNSSGPLQEETREVFASGIPKKFIAQELEHDKELIYRDGRPFVKYYVRYTEKFPDFLAGKICEFMMRG
jgi:hypothetical protein